jgi:hypothetical protein
MEMFRKPTWIELRVPPPVAGMVFIHVARPDRPLMITDILEDEIQRVDVAGVTAPWGSIEDWRDEVRHRNIEIVYDPKHYIQKR